MSLLFVATYSPFAAEDFDISYSFYLPSLLFVYLVPPLKPSPYTATDFDFPYSFYLHYCRAKNLASLLHGSSIPSSLPQILTSHRNSVYISPYLLPRISTFLTTSTSFPPFTAGNFNLPYSFYLHNYRIKNLLNLLFVYLPTAPIPSPMFCCLAKNPSSLLFVSIAPFSFSFLYINL